MSITAAHALVQTLVLNNIERAFCVPGESYIAVLDELRAARDTIELVVCRHEGGAAFMAEAHGRMTGRPGVCLVTRGPGATNAAIGVFSAAQEGIPMVLIVGQVAQQNIGRGAFQELDVATFFGGVAKRVIEINHSARVPELIGRAIDIAISGRPGPVVVSFPEDLQHQAITTSAPLPIQSAFSAPRASDMEQMGQLIQNAAWPMLVLGGSGWSSEAASAAAAFAETLRMPVTTSFRKQDLIDSDNPQYIGSLGPGADPELISALQRADLLLLAGATLGEVETAGFTRLTVPDPAQQIVQVGPEPSALQQAYRAVLAIVSDIASFFHAANTRPALAETPWAAETASQRERYLAFRAPRKVDTEINMSTFWSDLADQLPPNTLLTMGAGNYTHWILRHFHFRRFGTLLAPICAPMGYAVPAAVAASRQFPDRLVVSCSGDGCFLMNGQELATAAQYSANILFLVINNGLYGSVRMHQELRYPGRPYATNLTNPDFAALATAYGLPSASVTTTAELTAALGPMITSTTGPRLIEIRTDPEEITPAGSIDDIRKKPAN